MRKSKNFRSTIITFLIVTSVLALYRIHIESKNIGEYLSRERVSPISDERNETGALISDSKVVESSSDKDDGAQDVRVEVDMSLHHTKEEAVHDDKEIDPILLKQTEVMSEEQYIDTKHNGTK